MARSGPISLNRVKPSKTGLKTMISQSRPRAGAQDTTASRVGSSSLDGSSRLSSSGVLELVHVAHLGGDGAGGPDSAPRASFGAPQAVPPAACSWLARRDHVLPHTMQHETLRRTPRPRC